MVDVYPDEAAIRADGWHSQDSSDLLAVLGPAPVGIPSNRIPHFQRRMGGRTFRQWQAEQDARGARRGSPQMAPSVGGKAGASRFDVTQSAARGSAERSRNPLVLLESFPPPAMVLRLEGLHGQQSVFRDQKSGGGVHNALRPWNLKQSCRFPSFLGSGGDLVEDPRRLISAVAYSDRTGISQPSVSVQHRLIGGLSLVALPSLILRA